MTGKEIVNLINELRKLKVDDSKILNIIIEVETAEPKKVVSDLEESND